MQQVLAYETDLLEYDDLFDGSKVIEAKTAELVEAAQAELDDVLALGGAFEAIDELKGRLVRQPRRADARASSPATSRSSASTASPRRRRHRSGARSRILQVDPAVEARDDRRRRRRGAPTATTTP